MLYPEVSTGLHFTLVLGKKNIKQTKQTFHSPKGLSFSAPAELLGQTSWPYQKKTRDVLPALEVCGDSYYLQGSLLLFWGKDT